MAQRTINTSGASGLDQGTIDTLKAAMVPGALIRASHVNSLITLWNNFRNHTHTITDLYGIKEVGNTNPSGYAGPPGSSEADTTSIPTANGTAIAAVTAGTVITSAKHNELRNMFSTQLEHLHTWDDRIA